MSLPRASWSRSAPRLVIGPLLGLLGACTASLVERRIDELRTTLADAERRGAGSCAPVELALSSVHLEFAQLELREGDEQRAERHLVVAEPNGKAALRRTKEGDCHPSAEGPSASAGAQSASASARADTPRFHPKDTTSRSGQVAASSAPPPR
jgi:hypothetical protein